MNSHPAKRNPLRLIMPVYQYQVLKDDETVELFEVKLDNWPPDTETSLRAKLDAASLNVNVISNESLFVVAPSAITFPALFFAAMVMVGETVSIIKFLV